MNPLLVDIGNTLTKVAVKGEKGFKVVFELDTARVKETPDLLINRITGKELVVSSVVADLSDVIEKEIPSSLIVSPELRLPITISYKSPQSLGADRIAAACGSLDFYESSIVVMMGTATVIDLIVDRRFEGGAILPGIGMSIDCLSERTSKLPRLGEFRQVDFPGKSTEESIMAGITLMVSGAVGKVKERFNLPVLVTGGFAGSVKIEGRVVKDLIFRGLYRIWELNRGKSPGKFTCRKFP